MQSSTLEQTDPTTRHDDSDVSLDLPHPTANDAPVHPLIEQRWSPYAFADRPVAEETLHSLLEAARWAPSAYNEQPWQFVVATDRDPEAHDRMVDMLVEANREWAADAPVLMLTFAEQHFDMDGRPNGHARHDVGQAIAQLTLEAVSRGILVHQMSGILDDRILESYDIPEGIEPVTAVAIGYPPTPDELDEETLEQELSERTRKPLDEIVHRGHWEG
jgi:nitroreductase